VTDAGPACRRRLLHHWGALTSAVAILGCGGCASLGPRALRQERTDFNFAIQETQDTQLLLNLVRLRYRDTPVFLELSSITSQFTFEVGGEAGAELQKDADPWKLGVSAKLSSQPTVTYAPLQGEKFAQQLLSPLKIETLMLLYRSGWPLKRVLSLCVQRLNRAENAARASGPTPELAPAYQDFARAADLIADLNHRRQLDLVYEVAPGAEGSARIVMQVAPEASRAPETGELFKLLGLAPGKTRYPVTYFFLAQAVEPGEEDVRAGHVTVTRAATGEVFDWKAVTRGLMSIRSASDPPGGTRCRVRYRGRWFYIDDSDLSSKSTFALLTQLVALQSGEVTRLTPILTLPVGR